LRAVVLITQKFKVNEIETIYTSKQPKATSLVAKHFLKSIDIRSYRQAVKWDSCLATYKSVSM